MIVFKDVSKQFSTDSTGIQNISFTIEPGELVFVTGPSGSGKTTLMRLLTKEYLPTDGQILFNEEDITKLANRKLHQLRRKIGVVFQDYRLLPELNVWENIALPLYVVGKKQSEIEERVTDLLELIRLPDKAPLFPAQLSGGEAQRVSIARALSTAPEVIFADEPTGNLDDKTAHHIADLLEKINELGTTLFFATHNTDLINKYPRARVIRLENGKLVKNEKQETSVKSQEKSEKNKDSTTENSKTKQKESSQKNLETHQPKADKEPESEQTQKNSSENSEITTTSQQKSADESPQKPLASQAEEPAHSRKKPSFWQKLFGAKKKQEQAKKTAKDSQTDKKEEKSDSDNEENPTKKDTKVTSENSEQKSKDPSTNSEKEKKSEKNSKKESKK